MNFNIGLNFLETDGRASPVVVGAATSVTGFVIRSIRGANGVHRVSSWGQFLERFGGFHKDYFGAFALRGFFENGGAEAWVTRVAPGAVVREWEVTSGATTLHFSAGFRGSPDPGVWAENIVIATENFQIRQADADPLVRLSIGWKEGSTTQIVEVWEGVLSKVLLRINDSTTGSRYVTASSGASTTVGHSKISGADGNTPGEPHFQEALAGMEAYPIQLLCCPDQHTGVQSKGAECCKGSGDWMFIGHLPEGSRRLGSGLDASIASYCALYVPWVEVSDPAGGSRRVPPDGHIAGMYARIERERGVWKSPAGLGAGLYGVVGVADRISDKDFTNLVREFTTNCIRVLPGQGLVADSARTMSLDPRWYYVGTRLLFNFVKSSMKQGLRWAVHEPNDGFLWKKIEHQTLRPFLMNLWRRGAFGSNPPDKVFTIVIDDTNNSPTEIRAGQLNIGVYFYPVSPAETIVVTVGQQDDLSTVSES